MSINELSLARGRNWCLEAWRNEVTREVNRLVEHWQVHEPGRFPVAPARERPWEEEVFADDGSIVANNETYELHEQWEAFDEAIDRIYEEARERARKTFPKPSWERKAAPEASPIHTWNELKLKN